ncbi:PREDICTED: T-cell surface glycoprotein CD8 beta chain-like [Elephantulus edwardii]|uniref:T-cell surface glycoprotein CD8 beta chain-like n=1 Tax=Elephantulus edwardii TaxID=28737 RepID=UPI0003F0C46A|nr:PREDICTED: T-cell surface glycoprotein CD8 beta chain-like [Elephantulus edwardii]
MQPLLWLLLAAHFAALCDGLALHQTPRSVIVQTHQPAILSCEVKGHTSNKHVYWLRQHEAPSPSTRLEILAFWDSVKQTTGYGSSVKNDVTISQNGVRYLLNLTRVRPLDSGIYFCMTIGNPELDFGKGTQLTVVDILPTTAKPTRKQTPKKRMCQFTALLPQKGSSCSPITLGLLVVIILVLLVSLSLTIHLHCKWKRARLRFVKQLENKNLGKRCKCVLWGKVPMSVCSSDAYAQLEGNNKGSSGVALLFVPDLFFLHNTVHPCCEVKRIPEELHGD